MPIEIRELNIRTTVNEPSAVVYVMFKPEGTPVRAETRLPGKTAIYPDATAFASGLRTLGVTPGMKLDIVVAEPDHAATAGPPAPHVPTPLPNPGRPGPSAPKPNPSGGPVVFVPAPLPSLSGSAAALEIKKLETAVTRMGFGKSDPETRDALSLAGSDYLNKIADSPRP